MDTRQKRTHQDNATADSLIGKIFYVKCPDQKDWYRTVRIVRNFANGSLKTQLSNPVYGSPESLGLPEMPELIRNRLMSLNNMTPYSY